MPHTSILFLVAALAICGLPPLNGFVSEFLIYSGLFNGLKTGNMVSMLSLWFPFSGWWSLADLRLLCFTIAIRCGLSSKFASSFSWSANWKQRRKTYPDVYGDGINLRDWFVSAFFPWHAFQSRWSYLQINYLFQQKQHTRLRIGDTQWCILAGVQQG